MLLAATHWVELEDLDIIDEKQDLAVAEERFFQVYTSHGGRKKSMKKMTTYQSLGEGETDM